MIALEEYLNTSYDPDVEYVDGVLVERSVGEWLHSLTQSNVLVALDRANPRIYAVPSLRCRTRPTRYRLPDVCVVLAPPKTKYLLDAAFIAIEILSEDDRMTDVLERLAEYAANGTPHIWLIDPRLQRMFTFRDNTLAQVEILCTADPSLELIHEEVFASVTPA